MLRGAHPLFKAAALVDFGSKVLGAYSGRYGFECMEGECGYTSCEAEARSKAFEEEAQAYKIQAVCNFGVTPLPDDDRCYDKSGGLFAVSEVTVVEAITWACKNMKTVSYVDCDKIGAGGIFKQLAADPCNSPIGMCAPENGSRPSRASNNPSVPIPGPYQGSDLTCGGNRTQAAPLGPPRS